MWWFSFLKSNFQKHNNGVMQIILINGVVFVLLSVIKIIGFLLGHEGIYHFLMEQLSLSAMWPLFKCKPWTLLTYCFVQESFFSMICIFLTLYLFGSIIRNFLGNKHFISLYLLGGIIGGVFFILLYQFSPPFQGITTSLVGSTASIYAIMVCVAFLSPNFNVNLLLFGGIRMKYIVTFLIFLSLFTVTNKAYGSNSIAQLGGALVGLLYSRLGNKLDLFRHLSKFFQPKSKLKIIRYQPKKTKN